MYNQVNKILFVGAVSILLSVSLFIACQPKQETSEEETTEKVVVIDPSSDWMEYKENTSVAIAANEERIKVLKERIVKSGTPNLDKLRQNRIEALQAKNAALRANLADFREESVSATYEQFKADVRQQLDDIEKELEDLDK
jgi:hypothetical protein